MTHPPRSLIHSQKCSDNKSSLGIGSAPRLCTGAGLPASHWGCHIDSGASAYIGRVPDAGCEFRLPMDTWMQLISRQFCREVWLFRGKGLGYETNLESLAIGYRLIISCCCS